MGEGGTAERGKRKSQRVLASGPTTSYPLSPGLDLSNLTVVLTGGTSGLGLEAAKVQGRAMHCAGTLQEAQAGAMQTAVPARLPASQHRYRMPAAATLPS